MTCLGTSIQFRRSNYFCDFVDEYLQEWGCFDLEVAACCCNNHVQICYCGFLKPRQMRGYPRLGANMFTCCAFPANKNDRLPRPPSLFACRCKALRNFHQCCSTNDRITCPGSNDPSLPMCASWLLFFPRIGNSTAFRSPFLWFPYIYCCLFLQAEILESVAYLFGGSALDLLWPLTSPRLLKRTLTNCAATVDIVRICLVAGGFYKLGVTSDACISRLPFLS